ncbi:SRPBCC family protein [Sphingopyxis sp. 550A]
MYILSHSVEVNPAGSLPPLTVEQVWAGLVLKAENALPFVPSMQRCDLIERHARGLRRSITVGGQDFDEDILFFPPRMVRFDRVGSEDFILNTISDSASGLLLSFTFAMSFPGVADGSPEEQARGDAMREAYVGAVSATLAKVRAMVQAGDI